MQNNISLSNHSMLKLLKLCLLQMVIFIGFNSCTTVKYPYLSDSEVERLPMKGYVVDTVEIKNPIIVYYDEVVYVLDSTVINRPDFDVKTYVKDSITYICGDVVSDWRNFFLKMTGFVQEDTFFNDLNDWYASPSLKPIRKDSKGHAYVAFRPWTNSTKFYLSLENVFFYNGTTYINEDWDSCPKNCYCKIPVYRIKSYSPINTYVRVVYQIK